MSKLVTDRDLIKAIDDIILEAQDILLIVSPFVKLDDYFKRLFESHLNKPRLHIIVVFGKNENNVRRSLSAQDFAFFQQFPKVSIVYVPNLHAKYYGNENKEIITSINLYDFSFKSNIEFGVYSEHNLITKFINTTDNNAFETAMEIAHTNEAVFIKRPVYEEGMLPIITGRRYVKSDVLHNTTKRFYDGWGVKKETGRKIIDFEEEIILNAQSADRPKREDFQTPEYGYCIRTSAKIKYNPKSPFSYTAYTDWSRYNNRNYPEKYCHRTGQLSHGKTSMNKPEL